MTSEDSSGKGKGEAKATFDQRGQNVAGNQTNIDHLEGNIEQIGNRTVHEGDTINIGDIIGSNVNIKSNLQDASQTVGALPQVDPSVKEELQQLILQLNDTLQGAPADSATEVEEVSEATTLLVDAAAEEEPNKTLVKMLGAGLLNAATTLTNELPNVVEITGKIVKIAGVIAGLVA